MTKQELSALVAELLQEMTPPPAVKGGEYKPLAPEQEQTQDITAQDLRKLYLVEDPAREAEYRLLKERTPARLGMGRAGARYKTQTMLRFRADHAAAQDAVFSELPEDFGEKNGMLSVVTRCENKEQYLTRPDLGRCFSPASESLLRQHLQPNAQVLLVVGDGLSSAAIAANATDCLQAIKDGLQLRNIPVSQPVFVKYCRVGASDALGDITGCKLVCMLVGERPGLVTDQSMSVYLTYEPHTGIRESARTVVSNIHSQGTPAAEAGAYVAELIETILKKKVSGVQLRLEGSV